MKNKSKIMFSIILLGAIFLVGCTTPAVESNQELEQLQSEIEDKNAEIEELNKDVVELNNKIQELNNQLEELQQQISEEPEDVIELSTGPTPGASLMITALEAIELIADMNMDDLDVYVHPTKGVRFTPYDYVNTQDDIVIQAAQFQNLVNSPPVLLWGYFDGIGDPISLSFDDYYERFIYDVDFDNPHMYGNNTKIGVGNSLNNVDTAYPNGQFIEFHFTGFDPQYEGIDWKSLKLVFEDHNGAWYLVGIIHGEWTI